MPKNPRTPSYRHHKPSGQAVVTIGGRDIYLGKRGTKVSREQYDTVIAEWLARGRRLPAELSDATVSELIAAYWRFAQAYYRKDDRPTVEVAKIKAAMRPLKRLYGRSSASEFGPLRFKAVRREFINAGFSRTHVNQQAGIIKRLFKWAGENELVSPSVFHGLQTVSGLRRGRSEAREPEPVRPVPPDHVEAIEPHVAPQVWAMVQLQRLTGMRSGEVTTMRSRYLDMTGDVWLYTPESHKTQHYGHARVVELGPRAQRILQTFLDPDLDAYLFSPRVVCSRANKPARVHRRKDQKPTPRRTARRVGVRYSVDSYRRAVTRGCEAAGVPKWFPHQLRHLFATEVRKRYGIETARILCGHSTAFTTEIYAEADRQKARAIMRKIG